MPNLSTKRLALVALTAVATFALAAAFRTPSFDPATAAAVPDAGVTVRLLGDHMRPLAEGMLVQRDEALGVALRNLGGREVHVFVLAVDSAGAYHWLLPRRDEGKGDWGTKGVQPMQREALIQPPRTLGDLAPGPVTVLALVTPALMRLDMIERLDPGERTEAGLRNRFPDATVLAWTLELAGATVPIGP